RNDRDDVRYGVTHQATRILDGQPGQVIAGSGVGVRESPSRGCRLSDRRAAVTEVQCVRIDRATRARRLVRSRSVKGNDLTHENRIGRSGHEDGNGFTGLTEGIADSRIGTTGSRLDGFQKPSDAWCAD